MPLASFDFDSLSLISRGSNLARAQVQELQNMIGYFYPQVKFEAEFVESRGDRDKVTSLRGLEKTDFFTDTLDTALLQGKAQVALHSAKDLPDPLPNGLVIAAITPCIDPRDALVFAKTTNFDSASLSSQSFKVATSSKRREEAVREAIPHAVFCDLRGTIEERLKVIETGAADAVVLAEAALIRLGLTHLPRLYLSGKTTHGQGSLAIVVREDQPKLIEFFSILDIRQNRPKCVYLGIDPNAYQKKCPFDLLHAPLIETHNYLKDDPYLSKEAREGFSKSTHVIVTSPRAAHYLSKWIISQNIDSYNSKIFWCMGPATTSALDINIDLKQLKECPVQSTAEYMLSWIEHLDPSSSFVFFPHSERSRPLLKEALEKAKIPHLALAIYDTHLKKIDDWQLIHEADELIFSSPSCVQSLWDQGSPTATTLLRSIGPVTELALQKYKHHRYTSGIAL